MASEQRSRHALQGQCRSPSPHSQAAVPGDELGSVRRQPASAGKSDGLVHRGSNRNLAGRAAHNPGRSSSLFGFGDQNGVDVAGGVPIGAASDRRLDRLDPSTSGPGSGGAGSLNPEPSRRNVWRCQGLVRAPRGPVHLLVDSTGLRLCGPGEWLIEKHGTRRRRSWRKLHIGACSPPTSIRLMPRSQPACMFVLTREHEVLWGTQSCIRFRSLPSQHVYLPVNKATLKRSIAAP